MTVSSIYLQGTVIRCAGHFTDPLNSDEDIDPTNVYFSVRKPSGACVTYTYPTDPEIVRDSEGHYHCDVVLDQPKTWWYSFWSDGALGQANAETTLIVEPRYASTAT